MSNRPAATGTATPTLPALMVDSWLLANEAAMVVWLRSWRIMMGGPLAARESERMVSEKLTAALTLWPALLAGGAFPSPEATGARILAHYRAPVRANRRRLSRPGA